MSRVVDSYRKGFVAYIRVYGPLMLLFFIAITVGDMVQNQSYENAWLLLGLAVAVTVAITGGIWIWVVQTAKRELASRPQPPVEP